MAFKKYRQKNLAAGELDADLGASGTLVVLKAGQGALFPSTFPFAVKIEEYDTQGRVTKRNMAECTGITGDVLTVARSTEACPASFDAVTQTTTALAFASGSFIFQVTSAAQIDDIQDEVSRLETDKLDNDALRTGLTAKRVMITDGSGAETYLSGTLGQVVGFDADGDPEAQTPTVDINGLAAVTQLSANDAFIVYEDGVAANRKILSSDAQTEMLKPAFGNGADGSLTISSGTTAITATSGFVIKQYQDVTISGTATLDLQGEFNILYVNGTFTMSAGTVTAVGRGGVGGVTTADEKVSGAY